MGKAGAHQDRFGLWACTAIPVPRCAASGGMGGQQEMGTVENSARDILLLQEIPQSCHSQDPT